MTTRTSADLGYARYVFVVFGRDGVNFRHTVEARHASQAIECVKGLFGDRRFVLQIVERIDP